tara:strand:+ start:174 stop:1139 length:966 start_codon:yes stop_codon:yes gene_type:complete
MSDTVNITLLPFDEVKKVVIKYENYGKLTEGWPAEGGGQNHQLSWQNKLRQFCKKEFSPKYKLNKREYFSFAIACMIGANGMKRNKIWEDIADEFTSCQEKGDLDIGGAACACGHHISYMFRSSANNPPNEGGTCRTLCLGDTCIKKHMIIPALTAEQKKANPDEEKIKRLENEIENLNKKKCNRCEKKKGFGSFPTRKDNICEMCKKKEIAKQKKEKENKQKMVDAVSKRQKEKKFGRYGISKYDKMSNLIEGETFLISGVYKDKWKGQSTLKIETIVGEIFSCPEKIRKEIKSYFKKNGEIKGFKVIKQHGVSQDLEYF